VFGPELRFCLISLLVPRHVAQGCSRSRIEPWESALHDRNQKPQPDRAQALMQASSYGQYLNANIKVRFRSTRCRASEIVKESHKNHTVISMTYVFAVLFCRARHFGIRYRLLTPPTLRVGTLATRLSPVPDVGRRQAVASTKCSIEIGKIIEPNVVSEGADGSM
jgi:hypothetical protein